MPFSASTVRPGVVGDREQPGVREPPPGLDQRVLGERRAGLGHLGVRPATSSSPTTSTSGSAGQDAPQLGELLRVAGGQQDPASRRRPAPACCSSVSSAQPATARSSSASSSSRPERRALGGALHLDELAGAGDHDVHVGLGADVLVVHQVEPRLAVDDADRHRRDRVDQRLAAGPARPAPASQATASASATYAPVIAAVRVPPSACSTSQSMRDASSRRARRGRSRPAASGRSAGRSRACGRRSCRLHRLAVVAGEGGPRQHRVLGGDPAEPAALAPARHALGRPTAAHSTLVSPNSISADPSA